MGGVDVDELRDSPHVLIGSPSELRQSLEHLAESSIDEVVVAESSITRLGSAAIEVFGR